MYTNILIYVGPRQALFENLLGTSGAIFFTKLTLNKYFLGLNSI